MHDYRAATRLALRKNLTVKAHYRLPDGTVRVMIFGNSYKTYREQMDEYEDYGRRTELTLVELYQSSERFVQHGLKWCDYDSYQEELDFEAQDLKREPRRLTTFEWTGVIVYR
jgi:hypothetical protein